MNGLKALVVRPACSFRFLLLSRNHSLVSAALSPKLEGPPKRQFLRRKRHRGTGLVPAVDVLSIVLDARF